MTHPTHSPTLAWVACECSPCPGRGNDGHRMTHCAECCWGTGVEADIDCPVHGQSAYNSPTLAEFAAAVEAAKRGEHLPESDAWLEANARTRPDWADDSAAEDITRDRIEQRIDVDPRGDDRAADIYHEKRWGNDR